MALNAASHNPTATPTGSPSGPPPPTDTSITKVIHDSQTNDSTGQSVGGKGEDKYGNDEGQTVMGMAGKEKVPGEGENEREDGMGEGRP